MKINIINFLRIAVFLVVVPAFARTTLSQQPGTTSKTSDITRPLDVSSVLMTPDTRIEAGVSAGAEIYSHDPIAKIAERQMRMTADVSEYFVTVGLRDAQVQYARQSVDANVTSPGSSKDYGRDADIIRLRIVPHGIVVPWHGKAVVGTSVYRGEKSFAQHFAGISVERGLTRYNVGVTRSTGDASNETGVYANLQAPVSRVASIFIDYSSRSFQKTVINRFIVPLAGIDCERCSEAAASVGLAIAPRRNLLAILGLFDVDDFNSPFGGISMNREY